MPITLDETTLTSDQYNALKTTQKNAIYQIVAHNWQPVFASEHDTIVSATSDDFDAVIHDGKVFRISHDVVEKLDGTWSVISGYSLPTGFIGVPYSLISDTDLFVFALTASGIALRSWDGSSWSSWSTIVTDSTIKLMAAVSRDRVHYIVRDNTHNRYTFKVAEWDGMTWSITTSDINWPYPIFSFDAVSLNGVDSLVISSEVPGTLSAKFVNNQVVKYTLRAGGVVGFTYKYNSWSDHIEIDILDELTQYVYRSNVRLSLIGTKLWLSCYSSIGDEVSALTFYRTYTSKDALHWSRGEYFPIDTTERNGFNLLASGGKIYGIFRTKVFKATSTLMFDNSQGSQQLDITNDVLSMSIQRQDMQQINIVLDNSSHWVSSSILDGTKNVMLVVNLGYWIDGEQILIQTGLFEIDAIVPSEVLPDTQVEISGRDHLAWMATKTQAETFKYWEPQTTYGDTFVDTTATGYGGMGNSAIQTGSWRSEGGNLLLIDNNSEGIVFNTILSEDTWNGAIETAFFLSQLANNEYAGLLFRAQDKDNAFFYYYFQADDKLYFNQRVAGNVVPLWSSSAKSWSGSLNQRWLRVDYSYCRIRLYSSNDGITWVLENSLLVNGKPLGTVISPDGLISDTSAFTQSGFTGMIAKGHSDEATWSTDPGPIQIAEVPPDVYYFYDVPQALETPIRFWSIRGSPSTGGPGYVSIYQSGAWSNQSSAQGLPSSAPGILVAGATNAWDRNEKWAMFDSGLYKGRPWDMSPSWSKMLDHTIWATLGITSYFLSRFRFQDFAKSTFVEGQMLVMGYLDNSPSSHTSYYGLLAISDDSGVTWRITFIFEAQLVGQISHVYMSGWDATTYLLYAKTTSSESYQILRSDDGMLTWQLIYLDDGSRYPYKVIALSVPYRKLDGSPNLLGAEVYAIGNDGTNVALSRSDNGGLSFTFLSYLPAVYDNYTGNANLYVHPSSSLHLAFAYNSHIWYSDDGGLTWSDYDTGSSRKLTWVSGAVSSATFKVATGSVGSTLSKDMIYSVDESTTVDLNVFNNPGAGWIEAEFD